MEKTKKIINIIQISFGRYPLPCKCTGCDNIVYIISDLLSRYKELKVSLIDLSSKRHKNLKTNFKIYEIPNFIYWDDNDIIHIPKVILFNIFVGIKIILLRIFKKIQILHVYNQFTATVCILIKKFIGFNFKVVYTPLSVELIFPPPINLFKAPLEIFSINNSDCVIAVTPTMYNVLINRYKLPRNKVRQIFLGFEKDTVDNLLQYKNMPTDKKVITYVARINRRKNQMTIVKALNIIAKKYPNIVCNFIGSIDEEDYYLQLIDFIKENNLTNNVIFHGTLKREDVFKMLINSHLSIIPSKFETQGLMLIESLGCGVPVIASNIGPFRDVIGLQPEAGVLVEPDDYQSIALIAIDILSNEEKRIKMSEYAKKLSERFSWENIVEEIYLLYKDLVNTN